MDLVSRVRKYSVDKSLISPKDTILLGVSGGADSVFLAHLMNKLRVTFGLRIIMSHFNHRLRRGADADERFVQKLAAQLSMEFIVGSWKGTKIRSEEAARDQRFSFFVNTARKFNVDSVALAHTLDDQAETVLMRLIRGSGLQGMRGILPVSRIDGVRIIRPMLTIRRREIESYLKRVRISYRDDPSNKSKKFFRNKVRLDLLPYLESHFNPAIRDTLANLAENNSVDFEYLNNEAEKRFKRIVTNGTRHMVVFARTSFLKQPLAMQRLLIRKAYEYLKGDLRQLELRHLIEIETLLQRVPRGAVVHLPSRIVARISAAGLQLFVK